MENTLRNTESNDYLKDSIIRQYYTEYFNNMTSEELDKEFVRDIKKYSKKLALLSDKERNSFIEVFSSIIAFYLEKKIEKELEESIEKLIKL